MGKKRKYHFVSDDEQESPEQPFDISTSLKKENNIDVRTLQQCYSKKLYRADVRDDGNCLYYAIAAALNLSVDHDQTRYSNDKLRGMIAEHLQSIIKNKTQPLYRQLCVEIINRGGLSIRASEITDQQLQEYMNNVRSNSNHWGGELEISVLSKLLKRTIITMENNNNSSFNLKKFSSVEYRLSDKKTPVFIYYNGINHYNFLLPTSRDSNDIKKLFDTVSTKTPRDTAQKIYSVDDSDEENIVKPKAPAITYSGKLATPHNNQINKKPKKDKPKDSWCSTM